MLLSIFMHERELHMSCRRTWILVIAALLLSILKLSAVDAGPMPIKIDPVDAKNFMPVSEIKPGMKGYGKTVFLGTKIETFGVEVLGVLKNVSFNNGQDLILVRMTGGPMTQRGANLIEGMSGSPVYINGKLIGAFAWGEAFVKEPMGMVTPITEMMDAWNPCLPSKPSSFYSSATTTLDKPISCAGKTYEKIVLDNGDGGKSSYAAGTLVFRPLSMPITVSGISPRVLSLMQDQFKQLNLSVVAGPGRVTNRKDVDVDLVPGAAVGVSLVSGDMDMSAIGTVTYRRGNKILAFGHPMLGIGAIDAELTSAYVYGVMPSVYSSSKMASPIKPVGRLVQDRPWSIAGVIGEKANTIPVSVHMTDKYQGLKRDFNVQVANHPYLSRAFILAAAMEGITEMRPVPTDAVAKVKFEVVADEVGTITRENTYFDPISVALDSVSELQQILGMLHNNPFHPVGIKKVNMWVELDTSHPTAKLERIFLKDNKFEPGDTVQIGAVLKPFKGERVTKTLCLKLPNNTPTGNLVLQVGRPQVSGLMVMLGLADDGSGGMFGGPGAGTPPLPVTDTLTQQINKFLEREKNNDLVAKVTFPKPVPEIAGEKLTNLPPSIAEAMKSQRATPVGTDRDEIKQVIPTNWVLSGYQRLIITVRKSDKSEKRTRSKRGIDMPSMSGSPDPQSQSQPPSMDDMGDASDEMITSGLDTIALSTAAPSITAVPESSKSPQSAICPSPDDKSADKPDDKGDVKKEETPVSEKPVVRAPITWKQASKADFQSGTARDAVVTTSGDIRSSSYVSCLTELDEPYTWCLLPDGNGNVYSGTGNHGIIYKTSADGKTCVFFKSSELSIFSLAMDTQGNLYAGSSPHGIVYKIDPNGTAQKFFTANEKYIVALSFDHKGNLYAATGDKCKVYKIDPSGCATAVLDTQENHALSLAVDKDDNVFVGTGLNGLIYKITPSGETNVIYDAAEDSITALAINSKGVLYAGTGTKGVIYKLAPGANPKTVYDKAGSTIMSMSVDSADNVYAVNSSGMYKIMPDDAVGVFDNKLDLQFLSLTTKGGDLYAGTGNAGSIYHGILNKPVEGIYESSTHDCGLTSRWGSINWNSNLPSGASISFQTRTGNSSEPDATWSPWSPSYTASGDKIVSPAARYIQYRAVLSGCDCSTLAKLKSVNIVYLPANQAPKVTLQSPKGGEKWSKKQTIRWNGTDPDKDTLTYDLYYSSDEGKTWMPLKDKTEPAKDQPGKRKTPSEDKVSPVSKVSSNCSDLDLPDSKQMMEEMTSELSKHPEIPKEIKDKMVTDAQNMISDLSDDNPPASEDKTPVEKKSTGSMKQTNFNWNTAKVADGRYMVKVVVSDRLSNPVDALTGEAVSEPFTVVNKAPKLSLLKRTLSIEPDNGAKVQGFASQDLIAITGVQYRIDSTGDWTAAAPDDGIFDSSLESFTIKTLPLEKGEHTLEVKAIDQAGNSTTATLKVKVD